MIKDALQYLADLGKQAASVRVVPIDKVPDVVLVQYPDGNVEKMHAPIPARKHQVDRLDDLIAAANVYASDEAGHAAFWLCQRKIVLVLDDLDRRQSSIILPLNDSDEVASLLGIPSDGIGQKALISLLRFDWRGKWTAPTDLLSTLSNIDWTKARTDRVETVRSRASVSQSIAAECSAIDKVPDEVLLTIPVYATAGARSVQEIRCSLEPNLEFNKLMFRPFPNEVIRAREAVLAEIAASLDDTKIHTFFGTP